MTKECPICGKPADKKRIPFCSRRCSEIDLGHWFKGNYAMPVMEEDDIPEELDEEPRKTNGFTLIELSIVLVIIGLIAGGVLVGSTLIANANTRAFIAQMEKYKTALNAFKLKYNEIPGDISSGNASAFGLAARSGAAGSGDGNGLVQVCSTGACGGVSPTGDLVYLGGENILFWRDLSEAGLIDGGFSTAVDNVIITSAPPGQLLSYVPIAKGINNAFVLAYAHTLAGNAAPKERTNYFAITGISSTGPGGAVIIRLAITPRFAHTVDQKIDNGLPRSGSVVAHSPNSATPNSFLALTQGSTSCSNASGSEPVYVINQPYGENALCLMFVRF